MGSLFLRAVPQGSLSCPVGAIHLLPADNSGRLVAADNFGTDCRTGIVTLFHRPVPYLVKMFKFPFVGRLVAVDNSGLIGARRASLPCARGGGGPKGRRRGCRSEAAAAAVGISRKPWRFFGEAVKRRQVVPGDCRVASLLAITVLSAHSKRAICWVVWSAQREPPSDEGGAP